ncbi:MAG TPA: hypothetical protein VND65_05505 [Candidatus Binatia bacterium]|nr:hypothetical protein [Candidatus Binatia bacterium]
MALFAVLSYTSLSSRLLGDAGAGWHIRTGQIILATHSIPRTDPFSSSMSGHTWYAWEWLFDVGVGELDRAAGLNAVVAFAALVIGLTFSLSFRLLTRRGAGLLVALILTMLATSASMIHFQARPHVVSWLFTVIWLWILDSDGPEPEFGNSSGNPAWILPALMLLWVNIHGGFLIGFVLIAIYCVGAAWDWLTLKEERFEDALRKIRARSRVIVLATDFILCAAATLVNPYGYRLHIHIYRYLSNRFLMEHIDEFQSPNFHYAAQKCFAVLLILALIALTFKRKGIGPSHALLVVFAVFSGLYASRNIPVSSLLLILVIGPVFSDKVDEMTNWRNLERQFLDRMKAIELGSRGHLWAVAAVAFTIFVTVNGGRLQSAQLMNAQFDGRRFPVRAVDFLVTHHIPGPVLAPDAWGGYLIYRLYPRLKVVVDDRHDLYGEEFLRSYLKMIHLEPGWQDFLKQHPARVIVLPAGSALSNLLLEVPDWTRIYSDDTAVIFAPSLARD